MTLGSMSLQQDESVLMDDLQKRKNSGDCSSKGEDETYKGKGGEASLLMKLQ